MNKLEQAWHIAQTADVSTAPDAAVLYSISYLPSDENRCLAQQYIQKYPNCCTLEDTPCGKKLISLGLKANHEVPDEELMKIWGLASKRFIAAASGSVKAFVSGADRRSVFLTVELPNILKNPRIKIINGEDKFIFAAQFDQDN